MFFFFWHLENCFQNVVLTQQIKYQYTVQFFEILLICHSTIQIFQFFFFSKIAFGCSDKWKCRCFDRQASTGIIPHTNLTKMKASVRKEWQRHWLFFEHWRHETREIKSEIEICGSRKALTAWQIFSQTFLTTF